MTQAIDPRVFSLLEIGPFVGRNVPISKMGRSNYSFANPQKTRVVQAPAEMTVSIERERLDSRNLTAIS